LIGDLFQVSEYALNDAVAEWVGLDYATEHYDNGDRKHEYERSERGPSTLPSGVLFRLSCHDECFCNTTPLTDISVRRIITQVLMMHNFYYRKGYDWALATDDILNLLTKYKALRLRSHPATRLHSAVTNIGIPKEGWSIDQWRDQNRQPSFEWAGSVTFNDEIAQYHPSMVAPRGTDSN
jgi:hypothetical protein